MRNSKTLIYDGSFNGFLTAVYIAFEEKLHVADIQPNEQRQNGLFSETETIFTNVTKAKRVWNGVRARNHNTISTIYFAFLSGTEGIEMMCYAYIQELMATKDKKQVAFSDEIVSYLSQIARKVGREKQHIEAFISFKLTKDDIHFAIIEPDYDVLPLTSKHFRNKYNDQEWLIYDVKRGYGIFYNREHITLISLDLSEIHSNRTQKSKAFTSSDYGHQQLWNNYFQNTAIKARINRKLRTQQVPKDYSKYLSEKKEAV